MTKQHEMKNYPPKVSFDHEGNAVPHICIAVINGELCGKSYNDDVHPLRYRMEASAPLITEGPWAGWRDLGAIDER